MACAILKYVDSIVDSACRRIVLPLHAADMGADGTRHALTSRTVTSLHFAHSIFFSPYQRTAGERPNAFDHLPTGTESRRARGSCPLHQRGARVARYAGRTARERTGRSARSRKRLYAAADSRAPILRPSLEHSMLIDKFLSGRLSGAPKKATLWPLIHAQVFLIYARRNIVSLMASPEILSI